MKTIMVTVVKEYPNGGRVALRISNEDAEKWSNSVDEALDFAEKSGTPKPKITWQRICD